jgi:SNF2 family DNA or RNA helicase
MFATDGDSVYVTPKDEKQARFIEQSMGGTYSKAKKHCKLPRTMGVMLELHKKLPDLKSEVAFMEEGKKLREEMNWLLSKRQDTMVLEGDRLRPYQRADAEYLIGMEAAGIFNDPRTGKTPTLLEVIKGKRTKRNLIVAPASLLWTWHMQVKNWLPEYEPVVIEGTKKAEELTEAARTSAKPTVLIVSKNSLNGLKLDRFLFDLIAVDEAHYLRNHGTVQSKAVFKLKGSNRFALTGTPTVKHPSDIFGILKFLFPKKYTSFWGWAGRYFHKDSNVFSGGVDAGAPIPERQEEMQQEIGLVSVARKRKEAMNWLPEKDYKTIYSHMTVKQAKYYREMQDTFVAECLDTGKEVDAMNVMTQMLRLRQICIDPRLVGFPEKGCKTATLIQWLKDRDEDSRPVVVMSMFTSYLRLLRDDLAKEGYVVGEINGKMTAKKKQEEADKFQRGETHVLLCNTISAGTGWTLDQGDTVVFIDNAWNPADQQQAEDRVTPTTKEVEHGHNVIHIATMDSVDDYMFEVLKRKESMTDIINNGGREAVLRMIGR